MAMPRLTTALTSGDIALPDGPVAVLWPSVETDLSALPDPAVITGDRSVYDHWQAQGHAMACDTPATVVVTVPRSKRFARALVARAAATATGLVIVDGQKTDGIDGLYRDCRKVLGPLPTLTKAHGRLFWFAPTDALTDWADPGPQPGPDGFFTQPGVFSADKIDAGSALLVTHLPDTLTGHVVDLGAGWGYLSRVALACTAVTTLDVVETDQRALDCARLNLPDPRAAFHWADATRWSPASAVDTVIMNPPFHQGRKGDPGLGAAFIANAARILKPRGELWMVANRHLPYETALATHFKHVKELAGTGAFKLFHATHPKR